VDAFLRCPKLYEYEYELCFEPTEEDPVLTFGSGMHHALEARGKGKDLHAQVAAFSRTVKELPWHKVLIGQMLVALYNERYKNDGIEYLHAERPFCVTLPDGTIFRGKFDGICRDREGRLFIMEHKTTRSKIDDGERYWERKEINTQADSYVYAARMSGFDVEYIKYDVIKVPQLKPLKATPKARQEFYKRDGKYGKKGDPKPGTRLRTEGDAEFKARVAKYLLEGGDSLLKRVDFEKSLHDNQMAENNLMDIATLIKTGARPMNGASCFDFNRECDFRPVCKGETNLKNIMLYQINPNPLEY
jgi:hypothetical protein